MMRHALALTLILSLVSAATGQEPRPEKDNKLVPSITVSGTGKVNVKPDIAQVQVGVVSDAPLASDALTKNNKDMAALLEMLKAKGIEERDVQTTSFNVGPKYEYDPQGRRQPKLVGYQVTNMVQVRVRKLTQLGELLDVLVRTGANQVHGISFSVDEPEKLLGKARQEAVVQAKARAEEFATAAGVKVGRPLLIQEQSMGIPFPQPMQMMARGMAAADASVPVAAGEQTLSTQVTVTYSLVYPEGQ
ncbi:MAG: SIMPL domain-containing protein [Planctomycetes bacterium]|nr:SIMPL domain-containing protein [Planctomycetota bacterium]